MSGTRRKRDLRLPEEVTIPAPEPVQEELLADLRQLIQETRSAVAFTINAGLTLLSWRIGSRIRREILMEERARYGERIVHALSAQLRREFGEGFGPRNIIKTSFYDSVRENYEIQTPSRDP